MNFKKLALLLLFTGTCCSASLGQILDDSTELVYGPETTRYTYEQNIKFNREMYYNVDTLLDGFHRFSLVDRYKNKLQNLGNIGTANQSIFFEGPDVIGATSGFNAYDLYFKGPEDFKYYDTKSPYTRLYAVIGGNDRSMVDVDFSRNINPRWNAGVSYSSVTANKQVGTTGDPDDRNTRSIAYSIFTRFQTKDSAYQVLANFSRLGHAVKESGGILPGEQDVIPDDLFDYEDENVRLNSAESKEVRTNYHIYHQYKLTDFVQLFHAFDRTRQRVAFVDFPLSSPGDGAFYDMILIDPDTTNERSKFRLIQNQVGVKGNIGPLFYSLYVKRRDVKFIYTYLDPVGYETENFGGFDVRYDLNSLTYLDVFGEYELSGNYKFGARIRSNFLTASYTRYKYEPTYIQQRYFGNHDEWYNDFKSAQADVLKGAINVDLPFIKISPFISLSNVNDHIYYNTEAEPEQVGGTAQIISPGVDVHIDFLENFHFDNSATYTKVTGPAADIFRMPELFIISTFYYTNFLFNDKLQVRIGVDMHYQTAYFADDYDPVLMQFHLQNNFEIPEYVMADFFVNFKVKSARIFLKYTNISEAAGINPGYFPTPFYTGQRGTFDLGISWQFYD